MRFGVVLNLSSIIIRKTKNSAVVSALLFFFLSQPYRNPRLCINKQNGYDKGIINSME